MRPSLTRVGLCSILVAACLSLQTAGAAPAASKTVPFFAIHKSMVPVPDNVTVGWPEWTPDGRRILFVNLSDKTLWFADPRHHKVHCLTCGFADAPKWFPGFYFVLSGNKRLWISHGLGDRGGIDSGPDSDAVILECTPSVYHCASHRYLPVDMSEDKANGAVIVQRRTWHLAPDGVHVGWMDVRPDATLMIVGKLQRESDRYKVVDERIVNPPGPVSVADTAAVGWADAGQLYELKSFADGGRSIIAVAEPEDVGVDTIKIALATGNVTQLTSNPDWDEDGGISPDGELYAVGSWRTRHRIDAFGWIPEIPPFIALPQAAAIAIQYVSTPQGFQCNLSPWLLPSAGDDRGRLIGQPLDVYGPKMTAGNNVIGQQMWSPNSTEVLIQEATRDTTPGAGTPHRILIDRIARLPQPALPIVSSDVGSWAPTPADYRDPFTHGADVTINGAGGGTAHLVIKGNLDDGIWRVAFKGYSSDGKTFVDGTEAVTGSVTGKLHIKAAIAISGEHTGRLQADLTFDNSTRPVPTHQGTYTAVYDGRTAAALPLVGQCYNKLPHRYPLRLTLRRRGANEIATVTADIAGDTRPVEGARVTDGHRAVTTDAAGHATLRSPPGQPATVTATAGFIFVPVSVSE